MNLKDCGPQTVDVTAPRVPLVVKLFAAGVAVYALLKVGNREAKSSDAGK